MQKKLIASFINKIWSWRKTRKISKSENPQAETSTTKRTNIRWASWVVKNGIWSLPLAQRIAAGLKCSQPIVLRVVVCGQEEMEPGRLEYKGYDPDGNKRLRTTLATYVPAPIRLNNFGAFTSLNDANNFFVNFCVAVAGTKESNYKHCRGLALPVAKAINKGSLIEIDGVPVAEIIDNNLFIYVDLIMEGRGKFYYYGRSISPDPLVVGGDPMETILSLIIEKANMILP